MRVLIDTNGLISYLLKSQSPGGIREILAALADDTFTLLLPEPLLDELLEAVRGKPRLAKRIQLSELTAFLESLREVGELLPLIEEPIPAVLRDPKDDYLLAYALVGEADYLVSGDKDLLALDEQLDSLEIVTPRQFIDVLADIRGRGA
jgi:putative PIN family toxin of toxin-antitoxin system